MKAARSVRQKIMDHGPDSLWALADFPDLPVQAAAKALSRMARDGTLQRIRKGLYYYPKMTALGPSRPAADALLAKTIAAPKAATAYSGGTASFQNLGITTQVPAHYTILSNRASRKIRIGNITARVVRRNFDPSAGITQQDIWVLDAVRNIKHVPDSTPADAVRKIIHTLHSTKRPLKRLLKTAQSEPPRVRAVLGAIAEQIGYHGPEVQTLRRSLNPLTKFHLGVAPALPNAASWGIL